MDAKQILWELDALLRDAEVEQAKINTVMEAVGRQLADIARRQYPGLGEMDSTGLRELGELISRTAFRFGMDLDHIIAESDKRQK